MTDEELPVSLEPVDAEHLDEMVVDTITGAWSLPPATHGQGVFSMRFPTVVVLMTTGFDPPVVTVAGPLATGVPVDATALGAVNELNKAMAPFTFVLQDDSFVVTTHVPAMPFVPEHLLSAISAITDLSRELGPEIAAGLGANAAGEGA